MARIPEIEARLERWAEWLKVGDGSGYPVRCTLHEDWSPPSSGQVPSMKIRRASDAPATHSAVDSLAPSLRATVGAVYLLRMTPTQAAVVLDCQPDTVHARIERAHQLIALWLRDAEFCNIQSVG